MCCPDFPRRISSPPLDISFIGLFGGLGTVCELIKNSYGYKKQNPSEKSQTLKRPRTESNSNNNWLDPLL